MARVYQMGLSGSVAEKAKAMPLYQLNAFVCGMEQAIEASGFDVEAALSAERDKQAAIQKQIRRHGRSDARQRKKQYNRRK